MKPRLIDWFCLGWYKYLFSDLNWADDGRFHKLQVIWCRIKGHPRGPIWFSSGFEPDMSCKDCGDEL
jgi:hypothetical protein